MTREEMKEYFNPISLKDINFEQESEAERWGDKIDFYEKGKRFPIFGHATDMAIIGVEEDRLSVNAKGCANNPNMVRRFFYPLMPQQTDMNIIDCGNLKLGNKPEDTYYALADVLSTLMENRIIPIIIGGSSDLAIGVYRAYVNLSQIINILSLDAKFDLTNSESPIDDENYLQEIVCSEPNFLFDYTLAGYQSYFVDFRALDLLDDLHFDRVRLGLLQGNIEKIEPIVRDADMVMIDTNCIRASDAPSSPSPHGFYGEEVCKIANYAGMSDKLTSICFFGNNTIDDLNGRTSHIIAHAIYYFIDGYLWRKNDFPYDNDGNYIEFKVLMNNMEDEVSFFKSKKSDRWWIKVPCTNEAKRKYLRHYIVPCLYEDYLAATKGKMPDRWLSAYSKLNI